MADKEPTPQEDAAARAKEAAEQASLPYKWTQTISDLDITIEIPGNLKAKDLIVDIKRQSLKVSVKGQTPIIDDALPHAILLDDSTWTLSSLPSGSKALEIHLDKVNKMEWWAHVVVSAPKIDVTKITPENSKLGDLDGETRGMVEKMMWEQRDKEANGGISSEERKKKEILEKFQKEHPELDFSKAQMN
ncbi:hypothetical protein BTUL_0007g01010 [Botrytis tulipae]|uniref:Nuclear movement protein nudC n=2 Tax=Botrytis TaxID=33196 RepID=A0A4Z1F7L8_9HELO|nr:hypothetical protein BTUL_0007g01010 [Botrytis tulipae]TGO41323.1 hypothetical protein BHYA_0023g00330 [Botrytis hyacinthi]